MRLETCIKSAALIRSSWKGALLSDVIGHEVREVNSPVARTGDDEFDNMLDKLELLNHGSRRVQATSMEGYPEVKKEVSGMEQTV